MGSNQECPDPPFFQILEGGGTSLRLPPNQGCADFRPFFALNRENGITPKRFLSKLGTIFCEVLKGMANQEQLRTLKKEDVEVWNLWREDNPDVKIDLSDADLS